MLVMTDPTIQPKPTVDFSKDTIPYKSPFAKPEIKKADVWGDVRPDKTAEAKAEAAIASRLSPIPVSNNRNAPVVSAPSKVTNRTDFVEHLKKVLPTAGIDADMMVEVMPASIQTNFMGVKYIQFLLRDAMRRGIPTVDKETHFELEKLCTKLLK